MERTLVKPPAFLSLFLLSSMERKFEGKVAPNSQSGHLKGERLVGVRICLASFVQETTGRFLRTNDIESNN